MEHEMKLSPSTVRQSRIERGWSQEQLAVASGLSLRTVQRVESEGIASLSTASGLAATFAVSLLQLQEASTPSVSQKLSSAVYGVFYLGLTILMLAAMGESGQLPGDPQFAVVSAINILAALVGATLVIPSGLRILRARQYIGAILAVLGTPLVTLLLGGLLVSALVHRLPLWQLLGIGTAGGVLVVMSVREFRRGARQGPNHSSKRTRERPRAA